MVCPERNSDDQGSVHGKISHEPPLVLDMIKFRRIALLASLASLAVVAPVSSAPAQADTVDDVVCYVKTRNAYVCFRMGPSAQRQQFAADENAVLCYVKTHDMIKCFHAGP
jgi:hypothetical protein